MKTSRASDDARRDLDERLMARALKAGARGRPSPNPHVGAVVAKGGEIISVGYHPRVGKMHAEVMALQRAGERARGADLYVTFEPCNHQGRTGPCTDVIVRAGVRRVVIGCPDPAPHVPGALQRLRAQGIEVVMGVLREEAERLVADFTKLVLEGRPLVTLKAAVTLDGRMATRGGESKWITGEAARRQAHRLRARADAIVVGIGTVLADDPSLTVRHVRGRNPMRVVLDSQLRTPPRARVLQSGARTLILHARTAPAARRERLAKAGAELVAVRKSARGLDLGAALSELGRRDVMTVLVEGGPTLHGALLDSGLADRAAVFVAPRIVGDVKARAFASGRGHARLADAWSLTRIETKRLDDDVLICGDIRGRG